jgi:molecular chaperone GrpE
MTESEARTEEMEQPNDEAPSAEERAEPGAAEAEASETDPGVLDEELSEEGDALTSVEEEDLAATREELSALTDRHLRLAAEFNNYRRRVEQERRETWTRAQADLVGRLLDVVDDLQRVAQLDLSNTTADAIMEGIDLVERKFGRVLEDAGVEVIDPVGEAFDPEKMEAMMRVPAETEEDDDAVSQVFQKGYAFKGQLVRPARVSVHKRD